jgi:hypothetical protein
VEVEPVDLSAVELKNGIDRLQNGSPANWVRNISKIRNQIQGLDQVPIVE